MQITEQWILARAPSPAVAESGRALSAVGGFSGLRRTEDGKTVWAECAGSARNPYYVCVDWSLSENEPAFVCSCPERQTPCKHALGLMYELLAGKTFEVDETPPYVWKLRSRQIAERERTEARLERSRRQNAVMQSRKLERQLEGLDKAEKMLRELLRGGVDTISELPAQSLDRLAVELGSCELYGARDAFENIALTERLRQRGEASEQQCRAEILRVLVALRRLIASSREFIGDQLSARRYPMEEPLLYELLGGVWNPDELREVGMCRKNARLLQLSFDVSYDAARRVHVERGFWLELTRGDVVYTRSARSAKPMQGGESGDSCFDVLDIPLLYETPLAPCHRVWWDDETAQAPAESDFSAALTHAWTRVADAVRYASALLDDPLLPGCVPLLLRLGRLGRVDGTVVLEDADGGRIALRDRLWDGTERATVFRATTLPTPPREGDALFGLLFCDVSDGRYCFQPYSLIRAKEIVRLQF
ncbi:MAG: SWIM zinc finger family protein [Oscillospiraceae bacterium]|nr:SWIM zinc finger family protein [Oscillospiraceae bacterium]